MRLTLVFCLSLLVGIALQSCVITNQILTLNEPEQVIPLHAPGYQLPHPYEEVVMIELTGSIFTSRTKLKRRLLHVAQKHECEAVLNTRFQTVFLWPVISGVGVRYRK